MRHIAEFARRAPQATENEAHVLNNEVPPNQKPRPPVRIRLANSR